MSLPRSTYYKAPDAEHEQFQQQSDDALCRAIENVVDDWPAYGYRVTHELRRRGIVANHKRVARLMRQRGLQACAPRRFIATTDGEHDDPIFPNLARDFAPTGPDQLWVAHITDLQLPSRFAYLAAILDAWSRKIVGYAIGNTMETRLTLAALDGACRSRQPAQGLIHPLLR